MRVGLGAAWSHPSSTASTSLEQSCAPLFTIQGQALGTFSMNSSPEMCPQGPAKVTQTGHCSRSADDAALCPNAPTQSGKLSLAPEAGQEAGLGGTQDPGPHSHWRLRSRGEIGLRCCQPQDPCAFPFPEWALNEAKDQVQP